MTIAVGVFMLFAVAAIVMAILAAAGKGGPLMLPVAVVLLGILALLEHGGVAIR
jgi:predicted small lipoprotein YifL